MFTAKTLDSAIARSMTIRETLAPSRSQSELSDDYRRNQSMFPGELVTEKLLLEK